MMNKTMMAGLAGLSLFSFQVGAEDTATPVPPAAAVPAAEVAKVPAAEVPKAPAAEMKAPEVKKAAAVKTRQPVEKLRQRLAELTKQFDANQDGTLGADEAAQVETFLANPANKEEALLKQIKRFDTDGNWKLDDQEAAAAATEFKSPPVKPEKKAGKINKIKKKTPDYNIPDPNFMKPDKAAKSDGKAKTIQAE